MTGRNRQTLTNLLPRAALALSAAVLFAPSTARADCAAHLPNFSSFDLPFATPHDGRRPATHAAEHPSTPAPKPCSGPLCQEHNPLPPTPAPAPAPSVGGDEWGCVSAFHPAFALTPGGLLRDDVRARPVRRAADVFHPPRLSPSAV